MKLDLLIDVVVPGAVGVAALLLKKYHDDKPEATSEWAPFVPYVATILGAVGVEANIAPRHEDKFRAGLHAGLPGTVTGIYDQLIAENGGAGRRLRSRGAATPVRRGSPVARVAETPADFMARYPRGGI